MSVSEKKLSCVSSSGFMSESLIGLRMELALSSEVTLVIILAPIVRIVSYGRPRYSIRSSISINSLER